MRALEEAIEAGVDLVGGCPNLQDDPRSHIADMLALASSAGLDIDFHTDETLDPSVLTLRELARQIADKGFDGIVAASHCVSLGMQSPDVQAAVAAEVAAAEISVITLPQTNLFLQGRDDPTATPRGLTAVQPLVDAGVTVAAGADNVQDPFNLVGRSDPLETAALMVMAGHRQPDAAYDMVSNCSRQAMGLAPVNFEPGDPADFVAIDAPDPAGRSVRRPHVSPGVPPRPTSSQSRPTNPDPAPLTDSHQPPRRIIAVPRGPDPAPRARPDPAPRSVRGQVKPSRGAGSHHHRLERSHHRRRRRCSGLVGDHRCR